MWPPGGVQPPTADPAAVRRWRGLPVRGVVAGAAVLVLLGLLLLLVWLPADKPSEPSERYLRIRATCEDRATRQLDPIYQVGGRHWVDAVNRCMVDLATD